MPTIRFGSSSSCAGAFVLADDVIGAATHAWHCAETVLYLSDVRLECLAAHAILNNEIHVIMPLTRTYEYDFVVAHNNARKAEKDCVCVYFNAIINVWMPFSSSNTENLQTLTHSLVASPWHNNKKPNNDCEWIQRNRMKLALWDVHATQQPEDEMNQL